MLTGKQLRKLIRSLPTDGSAGDINQITATAMGQAPTPEKPAAPVLAKLKKPVDQIKALAISKGRGVRRAGSQKKRSASSLRIRDDAAAVASSYSSGLNIGGY